MGTPDVLIKRTIEDRIYDMDFSKILRSGETISTVQSLTVSPSGLVIGVASISGQKIQFRVSSGTDGIRYLIIAKILSSGGDIISGEGFLNIGDIPP